LLHHLSLHGNPLHIHAVEIEDQVSGIRADLFSWIEHPGFAQPINPRSLGYERRIVDVTRKHQVRVVAFDSLSQEFITAKFLPGPTDRRLVQRRVMNPDPPLLRASEVPLQ
jgi:hypothetical protein